MVLLNPPPQVESALVGSAVQEIMPIARTTEQALERIALQESTKP
jgi:hypothetical protein